MGTCQGRAPVTLNCLKRPEEEGLEAVLGAEAGFSVGSPSSSLCFQNVERLLENIGIKVGCLGAGCGAVRDPMGLEPGVGGHSNGPASSNPLLSLRRPP